MLVNKCSFSLNNGLLLVNKCLLSVNNNLLLLDKHLLSVNIGSLLVNKCSLLVNKSLLLAVFGLLLGENSVRFEGYENRKGGPLRPPLGFSASTD